MALLSELAHIDLGHVGTDADHWWPCRTNLTHRTVEIEAESVSSIVCTRAGLTTSAASDLAPSLEGGQRSPHGQHGIDRKDRGHA